MPRVFFGGEGRERPKVHEVTYLRQAAWRDAYFRLSGQTAANYKRAIKTHRHLALGLLLGLLCGGQAAPLRIASFNVEWGLGTPGSSNYESAAKHFERIGADILALQELQSDSANLATLQQRLGLPHGYRPTSSTLRVGLLSRYPFRSAPALIFQSGMTRPILLAQVDVPGVSNDPWVAVVHLQCCGSTGGEEQRIRATELHYLKQALLARGITAQDNVVLMGDFNLVATGNHTYLTGPEGISPFFAPASADGYFPDLDILKLELRHADGLADWSWRSNGSFPSSQLDHIMTSGPIRSSGPQSEIYDVVKDAAGLIGRPKFGDRAAAGTPYGSDHLPIFSDVVLRDTSDGFTADSSAPAMALQIASTSLNSPGGSLEPSATDVLVIDDQDPAPVVTCYPLLNSFTTTGSRTITYMGRDRFGNTATLNRSIRVLGAGATGFSANLQWPRQLVLARKADQIYAQIFVQGMSERTATAPDIQAWIGISDQDTSPSSWPESAWKPASLNPNANNASDEYMVTVQGSDFAPGSYRYASRWRIGNGDYLYGGINQANPNGGGGLWDGTTFTSGLLTVNSAFAGWSGGAPTGLEAVARYAIGGATSPSATDGVPSQTTLTGNNLLITAIVRTNDPNLTVFGQSTRNLSLGPWSTNGVTKTNAPDQSNVPSGTARQVFSIERGTNTSLFLRIESILQP